MRLGLHSDARLRGNVAVCLCVVTLATGLNLDVAFGDLAYWCGCWACSLPQLMQFV